MPATVPASGPLSRARRAPTNTRNAAISVGAGHARDNALAGSVRA